jgi:hypothetical protein
LNQMNRLQRMSLSALVMFVMLATSFAVLASPASATQKASGGNVPAAQSPTVSKIVGLGATKLSSVSADKKIDSTLVERMRGSSGPFKVYVFVTDRASVNQYLAANGLPTVKGAEIQGLPTTRVMELSSDQISTLAKMPGVYKIMTYDKPTYDQAPIDRALENLPIDIKAPGTNDFDVDYLHGAVGAWMEGFTGDGVKVADIDTGFDMSHPDLQGQQARYTDPASPYYGWPIAYDDRAAYLWAQDLIGGWVADTTATSPDLGGYVAFDGNDYNIAGLEDVMGNPVVSQSGVYHIGYHTDANLADLWGASIGVLVVDATTPGVYDTVYVDVTYDLDFSNDKACIKGDEISYFDFYNATAGTEDWSRWNGGDGYADIAGGMVYWISDGANVLPGTNWTYGATFTPMSGDAVAFVGEFYLGESHGTMTSSAALANGATLGGMLMGMAPEAKLIAIPFTNDIVASWLFAEMGADGIPNTGDEANIVTNSYGYSDMAIGAGYDIFDLYTSFISYLGPQTLWCWATGNGGPGYGTITSPQDLFAVQCGASITMQYRYWLGYEENYEYTTYGDIAPFSNSGPSRTGKLNSEIVASGMYSLEPAPLNEGAYGGWGDGSMHFQLGSGTSHATPTIAGGAALGFQAYYEATGYWPYMDEAKAKLMASADDIHYDPFKQGAGWLNATTYARVMGQYDGVASVAWGASEPALTKAALYPGSFDGTSTGARYEVFPNFLLPGEYDDSHVVTSTNYNPTTSADVTVTSKMLIRTGSDQIDWISTAGDQWFDVKPMIPAGTDLLRVTWYMPLNEFDPELDYVSNVSYWLEAHNWVDTNMDGIMNITGGQWELYRYTVDGSDCNYNQITIRDPIDRSNDGLIIRVRSIAGSAGLDMSLKLDYYQLQPFDWIQFREVGDTVWSPSITGTIDPMTSMSWEVNVTVPPDAYVGTYAGAIYIDDGSRLQNIPVVINVPATDYEFTFGGPSYFDTPYNNMFTGIADKGWRFEVGDWRMYWCLPSSPAPSPDASLIVTANWNALPTDVNVHVLAAFDAGGWPPAYDLPFGPNLLELPVASSNEHYMGAGIFGVGTSTGGPSEVIAAPMGAIDNMTGQMPFAIETRCAVMDGYQAQDVLSGYTTWLTLNDYGPRSIDIGSDSGIPLTGSTNAWYDMTVAGLVEAKGSGIGPLKKDFYPTEPIYQDALSGNFDADLANAAYTRAIQVSGASMLQVSTAEVSDAPDIDLGVWYDANMNGVAELSEPYWYVGISGSSETLTLDSPADGQYLVKVLGYTVTGNPGYFELTVLTGVPGYITAYMPDTWVTTGYYDFEVDYSVPAVTGVYLGTATFGFMGAADMFSIDVAITVDLTPPVIDNVLPADLAVVGSSSIVVSYVVDDSGGVVSTGLDPSSPWLVLDNSYMFDMAAPGAYVLGDSVYIPISLKLSEGLHYLFLYAADMWGNGVSTTTSFWVNSAIETFTAWWVDPSTSSTIPDGRTVSLTDVILRGYTDPNADVTIDAPLATYYLVADDSGFFEQDTVSLEEGLNIVTVSTMNNGSVSALMLKMIVSDTYCMLQVQEPMSPTSDAIAAIMGQTEVGATVTVNGDSVAVGPDGTFYTDVVLVEGLNAISVDAMDRVGNAAHTDIKVVLDTTPPSLVFLGPDDGSNTSEPSVTVYGTTDPDATVWVNGVVASNGTADWSAVIPLLEGWNSVTVTAADELGNSVSETRAFEYIPPVYVTPDELAAVQALLQDQLDSLTAALAENVSALQGQIDEQAAALAANVTQLQGQIDALTDSLGSDVAQLQTQIDALEDALAENRSALDALNITLQNDLNDLQDQLNGLNQTTQDDINTIDEKASDTDAFASMLMYVTLVLFAIAMILIGIVWYVMNGRIGGRSGGSAPAMEEVDTGSPSDVEKEFEALEKEIKKDEL